VTAKESAIRAELLALFAVQAQGVIRALSAAIEALAQPSSLLPSCDWPFKCSLQADQHLSGTMLPLKYTHTAAISAAVSMKQPFQPLSSHSMKASCFHEAGHTADLFHGFQKVQRSETVLPLAFYVSSCSSC